MIIEIPASASNFPEDFSVRVGGANSPDQATALNCSKCGAPSLRGAPMCRYCGSGLDSKITFDIDYCRSVATELEWGKNKELGYTRLEDALARAVQISEQKFEGKMVFFVFREIPVLVGGQITIQQALDNYKLASKLKQRDELGELWYKALSRFHELQRKLSTVDISVRLKIADVFFKNVGWDLGSSTYKLFFTTVSFVDMESLMSGMVGNNAVALNDCVEEIEKIMKKMKLI